MIDQIHTKNKIETTEWLSKRFPSKVADILVSWDKATCAMTNTDIFTAYWDDFCYPSSDDCDIIPIDGEWILQYDHHENFKIYKKQSNKAL